MTSPTIEAELRWHLGPGRADFLRGRGDNPLIPLVIQLRDGISPQEFFKAADPLIRPSNLYTEVLPALHPDFNNLRYVTALLDLNRYEALGDRAASLDREIVAVTASPPLFETMRSDAPWTEPDIGGLEPEEAPRPVVVGIIDDGIAFAHRRFQAPDGSRFEFFWMQDGPPSGPGYGHQLRKLEIDALLAAYPHGPLVDEDGLYRAAGVLHPEIPRGHKAILWRRAHGTHVLDIACNTPLAPAVDARIIGVQLPLATTGCPVDLTLGHFLEEGIIYILLNSLRVSLRIGRGILPVVINISYGLTNGPHDGTHILEGMIDTIATLWSTVFRVPVEVVFACGNSHVDRLHAVVEFGQGESVEIPWRIQPDDRTRSVVEVWLPPGSNPANTSRVSLSVFAPDGSESGPLKETAIPAQARLPITVGGVDAGTIEYKFFAGIGRGMYQIAVYPTVPNDTTATIAPCGMWRIRLTNTEAGDGAVVHAYVALDQAPYGYPRRGRQSYFDDPNYERYDHAGRLVEVDNHSIVKRYGSMNAFGTGKVPSVIGGVLRSEQVPPPYSAGGPTLSATRTGPDVLAVSDDTRVRRGVLAAGARSGSVVAMDGTSVAAPMVTRWVAGQLAAGASGNRNAVQGAADPFPALADEERRGAGRLVLPPTTSPGIER